MHASSPSESRLSSPRCSRSRSLIFVLVRLLPGNVIDLMLRRRRRGASPEHQAAREGAARPHRLLLRSSTGTGSAGIFQGDLGHSLLHLAADARRSLRTALPITIELVFLGLLIARRRSACRSASSRPSGATASTTTARASPACRDQHPELLAGDAAPDLHVARLPLGAAALVRPLLRGPDGRTCRRSSCRRSRSRSSRSRS